MYAMASGALIFMPRRVNVIFTWHDHVKYEKLQVE